MSGDSTDQSSSEDTCDKECKYTSIEDVKKLKVAELRTELKRLGLRVVGNKKALIARLSKKVSNFDQKSQNKSTDLPNVLNKIAKKTHSRSLVVLFSDLFTPKNDPTDIIRSMQHLKHNQNEILVFHVVDKKTESDFTFENRPIEFIDLESNKTVKLSPYEFKNQFHRDIKNWHHDLKVKFGQSKIDYIDVDIDSPVQKVLNDYLIKRKKMG